MKNPWWKKNRSRKRKHELNLDSSDPIGHGLVFGSLLLLVTASAIIVRNMQACESTPVETDPEIQDAEFEILHPKQLPTSTPLNDGIHTGESASD